jgi:molybdate transport system permease protein
VRRLQTAAIAIVCAVFVLFIFIPVLAVFLYVSPADFVSTITSSAIVTPLKLSLLTATASAVIVFLFATPLSYALARKEFAGRWFLDTVVDIPIVLPPAVAGLALLLAFAPRGIVGQFLLHYGIILPGSTVAVIMAEVFVASPFYVRSAKTAFENVSQRIVDSARVLTKSDSRIFLRVTLPLARRGILAGFIMCWARALGEFGATLLFAGNLPGVTQTMPLAIYLAMEGNLVEADVLSAILIVISFAVLVGFKFLGGWGRSR